MQAEELTRVLKPKQKEQLFLDLLDKTDRGQSNSGCASKYMKYKFTYEFFLVSVNNANHLYILINTKYSIKFAY